MKKKTIMSRGLFYGLSLTWGLPLNLLGLPVVLVMLATRHPIHRYGWCYYFEIGNLWGGCELGVFFLKDRQSGEELCAHEFGHGIQNAIYGPLMPFLVSIPSMIRYWTRKLEERSSHKLRTDYYAIWFERQASRLGHRYAQKR